MSGYSQNEYVVLIEDSVADSNLFYAVLSLQNIVIKLEVFSYGEQALKFLSDPDIAPPRTIITDVSLPDISGIELLQQLRELPHMKHVPVFVWSSGQSERDQSLCERFSATTYLNKPMSLPEWEDSLALMLQ